MGKFVDLTDQVFSRLTVLSRAENKGKDACWSCLCQCGKQTTVKASQLKNGKTRSCGCIRAEETSSRLKKDLTGQVFGRLTVISQDENTRKVLFWHCLCECGTETRVSGGHLKNGHTQSCGCLRSEVHSSACYTPTHGMSRTPEYRIWAGMKERCYNPKASHYDRYGGRGITVCDRWLNSFENFLEDMGPRPSPEHSIDRKENDGNYEPGNCRWATDEEQFNNRGSSRYLTIGNVTMTVAQWARQEKVTDSLITGRLNRGWSDYDAVMTPVRSKKAA